MTSEDSRSV